MKLPRVSGKQTVDTLLKAGFTVHRTRGSHYLLKHAVTGRRVTILYHRREIAPKTIHTILKQADIGPASFATLL